MSEAAIKTLARFLGHIVFVLVVVLVLIVAGVFLFRSSPQAPVPPISGEAKMSAPVQGSPTKEASHQNKNQLEEKSIQIVENEALKIDGFYTISNGNIVLGRVKVHKGIGYSSAEVGDFTFHQDFQKLEIVIGNQIRVTCVSKAKSPTVQTIDVERGSDDERQISVDGRLFIHESTNGKIISIMWIPDSGNMKEETITLKLDSPSR